MSRYFQQDVLGDWDKRLNMRTVPGTVDVLQLTKPLPCGDGVIPVGFIWNGASVGLLRSIPFLGFPKWKHPIATCRHDYRCTRAGADKRLRKVADQMFKQDVRVNGTWWERQKGFIGVRLGAIFGAGTD